MLDADRKLRHGTVCIKVGSAVVAPDGLLSEAEVGRLARELCAVREAGARVVLVSSGAVACGLSAMGLPGMPDRMSDRQAAAAAGQPALMAAWSAAFGAFGVRVGQILLTADDIEDRARFINARRTLGALMDAGVVPIVNENDSVSFDELRVGDNDRLSAFAAGLCGASLLVLLSAAPGLCEGGPGGPVLGEVLNIADATEHVSSERSSTGVGGMATKLDAAHLARDMGIETVIAPGRVCDAERDSVLRIVRGDAIGTRFPVPDTDGVRGGMGLARKHWIGAAARPRGVIEVDAGARAAVCDRGASLLPGGVVGVETASAAGFEAGEAVDVSCGGRVFARGLASYRSDEIARIAGLRSVEIVGVLGYCACDEVVHRDNMIVFPGKDEA